METPRSKSQLSSNRGVRVVGKIRPFLDSDASGASNGGSSSCSTNSSQISMSRNDGELASVAFADQANSRKDSYKLDWCYGQDEGIGKVFSKEVKPLLQGILKGCNACVIAYGARGSGKTQLIQGSEENSGLAQMAISEILPIVEELGGLVTISCYEVCQDRVYDLLGPKEQEVLVREDANRRIQLKGLSQVAVKSVSDFKRFYFHGCNERKHLDKATSDVAVRSHRGLIMYVSYVDKDSNNSLVGKINFVDLAGYEDTKKKNFAKPKLAEIAKVNKSLYALLNVVCALNGSETYIPYRETKLTHLLQDFLCRTSAAVLFTCLNLSPCPDTIHAVCLASRSCQVVNRYRNDSAKNNKSASRFVPPCSPNKERSRLLDASVKKLEVSQLSSGKKKDYGSPSMTNKRFQPLSNLQRKLGTSLQNSTEKKVTGLSSTRKSVRKILNMKSPTASSEKDTWTLGNPKDAQPSMLEVIVQVPDSQSLLEANDTGSPISKENVLIVNEINVMKATDPGSPFSKENIPKANAHNILEATDAGDPIPKQDVCAENAQNYRKEHNDDGNKQKQTSNTDAGGPSPKVSDILREISNSLRLVSSKPITVATPLELSCKNQVTADSLEPKTPRAPVCFRIDGDPRYEDMGTPQDILKARSTGLKKSLVDECLNFLNSASKEELKNLKGIGDKRASYIVGVRERTPEPFKKIEDIKVLGLSSKEIKGMMSQLLGDF